MVFRIAHFVFAHHVMDTFAANMSQQVFLTTFLSFSISALLIVLCSRVLVPRFSPPVVEDGAAKPLERQYIDAYCEKLDRWSHWSVCTALVYRFFTKAPRAALGDHDLFQSREEGRYLYFHIVFAVLFRERQAVPRFSGLGSPMHRRSSIAYVAAVSFLAAILGAAGSIVVYTVAPYAYLYARLIALAVMALVALVVFLVAMRDLRNMMALLSPMVFFQGLLLRELSPWMELRDVVYLSYVCLHYLETVSPQGSFEPICTVVETGTREVVQDLIDEMVTEDQPTEGADAILVSLAHQILQRSKT